MSRYVLVAVCVVLGAMMVLDAGHAPPPPSIASAPASPATTAPQAVIHVARRPVVPPAPLPDVTTTSLDLYARLAVRRRLAREGSRVYLDSMLAHDDSTVVRWDAHPVITVAFVPDSELRGWSDQLVDDARAGMLAWSDNPVGISFRPVPSPDSADITVRWTPSFADSTQVGATQLSWDATGVVRSASITLALRRGTDTTLLPATVRRRVAAHEFGHALGLPHSDDVNDLMFRASPVAAPSGRDEATLRLLYAVPPGPLRLPE